MKLSISRETLFRALKHASAVVEKRSTIAILGNVRLVATKDQLELTGTDNDLTVQGTAEAFVDKEGTTTVGATKMFEIVSKIPEGVMVNLELVDGGSRLAMSAGKANFSLATLGAEAFPDMTRVTDGVAFTLPSADLKRLLDKVSFAASSDETRAYLTGVYLHEVEEDGEALLRAVATDGHRLAKADMPLPEGAAGMVGVILPKKCVAELKKLAEIGKEVKLTLAESKIQAEAGDITMTSKVIDASFPDYGRVIPPVAKDVLTVARKSLLQAVERVSILSHEKTRSVRLKADGGSVTLSANNPDQENANEDVKVDYAGQPLEIGFNARYLAEIGSQIEGDDMVLHCKDSNSPVMVRDPGDAHSLFVVMPMRV
ncbi:MAG: DNA polymerase III subunit beta [Alphaproteobacteria bacterium CG_4_10_14_0_8_um_filter_53_9]|nr:MAG: DNA polymerase III subunit beta [Alphaproteobacteria bacterium CG_4_10_14_0_8_um_filter_53_9]